MIRRLPFLDPSRLAEDENVAGVGGPLTVETLLEAYRRGVFPWPARGLPLLWHSPNPRGVLFLSERHVPRRLARLRRKAPYRITFDRAFERVIERCAKISRPAEEGTWITPAMLDAYAALHRAGHAHSVEAWDRDRLVGGLYGVAVDGTFSGESMFHEADDASKLCLLELLDQLEARGLDWIDVQMVTPALESFGARYIGRPEFLRLLEAARKAGRPSPFLDSPR